MTAFGQEVGSALSDAPLGGDIPAARAVVDPHPAFIGIAVDPENDVVVMGDTNRKSLLIYDRRADGGPSRAVTDPRRQIIGPATNIGFVAGVAVDPRRREIFAVNNDIEDTMLVMSYDAQGNSKPARLLSVPHQAWGLALSPARQELAVSVEMHNGIAIYRREARGIEPPQRTIKGPHTAMADPHGIYWDDAHGEIAVANHGNFRGLIKNTGSGCVLTSPTDAASALGTAEGEGGQFQPPSITVYAATSSGDEKPRRTIQGARTQLDWPMGLAVDPRHNEIFVANNGDHSILVFRRTAEGDIAPVRIIHGERTGIARPMGVAVDPAHDELWVSNFGDHTALVFPRAAHGDIAPKRLIRSAPAGAPSTGFGNPMAVAYDSKRQEILVPN